MLRSYLEGSGLDLEVYEPAWAPGRASLVARIEGTDPERAHALPHGPHRRRAGQPQDLDARPVRRRAGERRGLGARRDRHAEHHRVPGGGAPGAGASAAGAPGDAGLPRLRRRGGGGRPRRRVRRRPALGRDRGGLLPDRERGPGQRGTAKGLTSPCTSARRASPGAGCGSGERPATARCPTGRQRAGQGRQGGRAGWPTTARRRTWTSCGGRFVDTLSLDPALTAALVDPSRVDDAIARLAPAWPGMAWSSTHTTFSPNQCHGGVKTNVIPDVVEVEVDIRTVPGDSDDEVRRHLDKALGDLSTRWRSSRSSRSPRRSRPRAPRSGTSSPCRRRALPGRAPPAPPDRRVHRCAATSGSGARWPTDSASSRRALTAETMAAAVPRQRRARRRGVAGAHDAGVARRVRAAPRLTAPPP